MLVAFSALFTMIGFFGMILGALFIPGFKNNPKDALLGVMLVISEIFFIASMDENYFYFLFFGLILYSFCPLVYRTVSNEYDREKAVESVNLYIEKTDKFLCECENEGINSFKSNTDFEKANLIAKNLNIPYKDISDLIIEAKEFKKYKIKPKPYVSLIDLLNQEKENSAKLYRSQYTFYKEKRLSMLNNQINDFKNQIAMYDSWSDSIINSGIETKTDWAIQGGLASAIGGQAAGVARAIEIQHKNALVDLNNSETRKRNYERNKDLLRSFRQFQEEINIKLKETESQYKSSIIKLYEKQPLEDLKENIVFEDYQLEISDTGSISIKVTASVKTKMFIRTNIPAVIDGRISANISESNNKICEILLVVPAMGITKHTELQGLWVNESKKKINGYADFKIDYQFKDLWLVEV